MQHILPILMRYRYLILASLSLLLISEMVVVDIDFVPVEYEWVFRCLVALTMVAWTGILCVIGYGPPTDRAIPKRSPNIYVPDSSVVDALEDEPKFTQEYLRAMYPSVIDALEDEPKHRGHTILVLSPALFVMFALLSIWGANLYQAQFLLDLIRWPYWFVFFMVWIGIVVIVGSTVNIDSSKKTYLVVNVFPILILELSMLYMAASSESEVWYGVMYLFGGLVVFLSYFLIVRAVVLRTMLPDKYWIRSAVISFGISVALSAVSFMPVMLVVLEAVSSVERCRGDCAQIGVGFVAAVVIIIPIVMSLTISVPLTILIGTMRRPIRNVTTAVGLMAPLIMLFVVLYWFNIWFNLL